MIKELRLSDEESEKNSTPLVYLEEMGAHKQLEYWEAGLEPRDELLKPNDGQDVLLNSKVHWTVM